MRLRADIIQHPALFVSLHLESSMPRLPQQPDFNHSWTNVVCILDLLFRPPRDIDLESSSLTTEQYLLVYTFVHSCKIQKMKELYRRLDDYFGEVCRDIATETKAGAAAADEPSVIQYYLDTYQSYVAALDTTSRLFRSLERFHIKRDRDEGRGWFEWDNRRRPVPLHNRIPVLIENWALPVNFTQKDLAEAEMRAEVASRRDRTVSIKAMGLRCWRLEVAEVLFGVDEVGPECGRTIFRGAVDHLVTSHVEDGLSRRLLLEALEASLGQVGAKLDGLVMENLVERIELLSTREQGHATRDPGISLDFSAFDIGSVSGLPGNILGSRPTRKKANKEAEANENQEGNF